MRIGFDGLTITARPAGVGSVAMELLAHLAALSDGPEILAVLPRGSAADERVRARPRIDVVRAPVDGPDTPSALLFQHRTLPRVLRDGGCDAMIAPAFVLPLFRDSPPALVVFHDAAWRRFPETKSARFRAYMDFAVPRSLRRARSVVAVSEFARREALDLVPDLPPERVVVVPPGARLRPPPRDPVSALERLGVRPPYLLAVSNFDERKNLPALVAAWRRLRADDGTPRSLVLAGDPARAAAFRERVGARDDEPLLTPGYVSDEDLAALYARADLVVVPSLYEGFGLPVIEAFAAGAPVACSDRASLPEVAGDAAVLFDPTDESSMVRALREALRPGAERDARVALGRARAAEFTWERTAREVLRLSSA